MTYTYYWANEEQTSIKAEAEDGQALWIPVCEGNRHYQEYLEADVSPYPYEAPPEPPPLTTEEKVNHLLTDYGLTRDELRAAL